MNQFCCCFIARNIHHAFLHLPELHVQTFDRIGRLDDLSNFRTEAKKNGALVPSDVAALSANNSSVNSSLLFVFFWVISFFQIVTYTQTFRQATGTAEPQLR